MKTTVFRHISTIVLVLLSSVFLSLAQSAPLKGSSVTVMDVKAVEASMLLAQQSVDFDMYDAYLDDASGPGKSKLLRDKEKTEFVNVETFPAPESGVELASLVQGSIEYPQSAIDLGIEGTVRVMCTVEKDGSVSSLVILNDIGANCAEEVCRVIRKVKFKPAMQNGYPRRCTLVIPVVFDMQEIN
jgi:TonB family protein